VFNLPLEKYFFQSQSGSVVIINTLSTEALLEDIKKHTSTGRPVGDELFIEKLEAFTGRELKRKKSGPKIR